MCKVNYQFSGWQLPRKIQSTQCQCHLTTWVIFLSIHSNRIYSLLLITFSWVDMIILQWVLCNLMVSWTLAVHVLGGFTRGPVDTRCGSSFPATSTTPRTRTTRADTNATTKCTPWCSALTNMRSTTNTRCLATQRMKMTTPSLSRMIRARRRCLPHTLTSAAVSSPRTPPQTAPAASPGLPPLGQYFVNVSFKLIFYRDFEMLWHFWRVIPLYVLLHIITTWILCNSWVHIYISTV